MLLFGFCFVSYFFKLSVRRKVLLPLIKTFFAIPLQIFFCLISSFNLQNHKKSFGYLLYMLVRLESSQKSKPYFKCHTFRIAVRIYRMVCKTHLISLTCRIDDMIYMNERKNKTQTQRLHKNRPEFERFYSPTSIPCRSSIDFANGPIDRNMF